MPKIIFLDTNVYLHYQDIDHIDWLEIADAETVRIVVPPVTLRELNKLKDSHPQKRIRNRAGLVIKRLSKLINSTPQASLSQHITIFFESREPKIDFEEYQLSRELQDDNLIASIIMHQGENPDSEVALVTSDIGLTLITKAMHHRIDTILPPEKYKLPEEPDHEQEQIRQLKKEIQELKSKLPKLSLSFKNGSQHSEFTLQIPVELKKNEIEEKVNELKERNPQMSETQQDSEDLNLTNPTLRTIKEAFEMGKTPFPKTISPEDITNYNTKLEGYFQAYEEYIPEEIQFKNLERRTIKLGIFLKNDGTEPAEDIDISMHFPDGLRVINKGDFPQPPQPPVLPSRPKTAWEKFLESMKRRDIIPYLRTNNIGPIQTYTREPPNVSSPNIKETDSYTVDLHVNYLKHNNVEPFDELYIIFDSFDGAQSFHIDYKLLAANLPSVTSGEIHLIIQKDE